MTCFEISSDLISNLAILRINKEQFWSKDLNCPLLPGSSELPIKIGMLGAEAGQFSEMTVSLGEQGRQKPQ